MANIDESPWPFRAFVLGSAVFSAVVARTIFAQRQARIDMGARYEIAKAIVEKWYAYFARVPPPLVLAIMGHESGFNPSAMNLTGKDLARGGAYGLMQMTATTAADVVKTLATIKLSPVMNALKRYDPNSARSLLDPDLNVLLGMGYLNSLAKVYNNDSDMVVAAYNRGRKGADTLLAQSGKSAVIALPYVAAVNLLRKQLEKGTA